MSWGCLPSPDRKPVCLEAVADGVVERLPAPAPDPMRTIPQGESSRVDVLVTSVRDGRVWQPASGKATLRVSGHLLGVHRGDQVANSCSVRQTTTCTEPWAV